MSFLKDKKILLGITAGIAAYKTTFLVRLFIRAGAEVKVIMTPKAKDFVTPLTLSTLSKNPVVSEFYDKEGENELWNNHVELGLWADLLLIAPATANTLAKMADGTCDNLVLASYLSAKCPVYFAPAMDLDMYLHPSTRKSLETLQSYGNKMIPAESGELASGLSGQGRMAEPENIIRFITDDIAEQLPWRGKKVLITAGPTYEAIDPVRFIGNHSSGKMGIALAEAAVQRGAEVYLILGPSSQTVSHPAIQRIDIVSAEDMFEAVQQKFSNVDIAIAAAAVADYRPKTIATQKIKKKDGDFKIELERTQDILQWMGTHKSKQILVGFALETENEKENAQKKLERKNLDMIVLNSLNDKGAGFKKDTNKITILHHNLESKTFTLKTKTEVAEDILNEINEI